MPEFRKIFRNQFTTETTILNNRAEKNPFTKNPGTIRDASRIISALRTNIKSPSVKMVTGSVRSKRIGLRNVFKIPRTIANTIIVITFATSIPGVI